MIEFILRAALARLVGPESAYGALAVESVRIAIEDTL